MSYDISIRVKAEGCDKYPVIAYPEFGNPTHDLEKMFRACMDWDCSQSEVGKDGKYHKCYYRCDFVIKKVELGIKELTENRKEYEKYNSENGWGDLDGALKVLESLRECIYEQAEEIPLDCLYMSW